MSKIKNYSILIKLYQHLVQSEGIKKLAIYMTYVCNFCTSIDIEHEVP